MKKVERVKVTSEGGITVSAKLYSQKENYTFGGFMLVSFASFLEIRRLGLSARQREVLDYLMLKVEFGNVAVGIVTQEMATELNSASAVVSRCLTRLENCELIERGSPGTVYLNPNFWFKGTPQEQRTAVFKWHQKKMARLAKSNVA